MEIHVHVNSHDYYFDKRVEIILNLPFIPTTGDTIILTDKDRDRLLEMCKKYVNSYRILMPYFDSISNNLDPEKMDMQTDVEVIDRRYDCRNDTIHIEVKCN